MAAGDIETEIKHYKKKIIRYSNEENTDKLLYCIHKLKYLPISVQHLESTGVGVVVNSLRHVPGVVGAKSNVLVNKWKNMVADEIDKETASKVKKKAPQISKKKAPQISHSNIEEDQDCNDSDDGDCLLIAETKKEEPVSLNKNYYVPSVLPDDDNIQAMIKEEISTTLEIYSNKISITKDTQNNEHSKSNYKESKRSSVKSHEKSGTSRIDKDKNLTKIPSSHRREHSSKKSSEKKKSKRSDKNKKSKITPNAEKYINKTSNATNSKQNVISDFDAALSGVKPHSKKKSKSKSRLKEKESSSSHTKEKSHSSKISNFEPPQSLEPEIAPSKLLTSYKPLPQISKKDPIKSNQRTLATDEEALNFMFSMKKNRQRKIYTGNSTGITFIPSLSELCRKVLLENVEVLKGHSFETIEPVLGKVSPEQLFELETCNPCIIESTDALWESHCKRLFKCQKRQEHEYWREMFVRCSCEQQEKLKSVTESLQKRYITTAPEKRTTKLTQINVVGKLKKNSTNIRRIDGPRAPSTTMIISEPQHLPRPGKRPRVAPLMARSLQLHKKVCRR